MTPKTSTSELFTRPLTVKFGEKDMERVIVEANKRKTSAASIIRQAVSEFLERLDK